MLVTLVLAMAAIVSNEKIRLGLVANGIDELVIWWTLNDYLWTIVGDPHTLASRESLVCQTLESFLTTRAKVRDIHGYLLFEIVLQTSSRISSASVSFGSCPGPP